MVLKNNTVNKLPKLLTTMLLLSCILSCSKTYADGFYEEPFLSAEANKKQLINPIYLNIPKSTDNNTIIPFKLRKFDEADYFSSSIEPSENPIKNVSYEQPLIEKPAERDFIPTQNNDNFFNPIAETQPEKTYTTGRNIFSDIKVSEPETPSYVASIENNSENNVDIDGKFISSVKVIGLKTFDENQALELINIKRGDFFSTEMVQKSLQKLYSTGYFNENISAEPTLNPDDSIDIVFTLEENILVSNIKITGNSVFSTAELQKYILGLNNKPQNLIEINKSVEKIQEHYHENGYILAKVVSVEDNSEGELTFNIAEGIINSIKISGNENTKDYVITRNIITHAGSVYNEEYLKKDLAKVFSTQIFDEVNREISPSENNDNTYDVTVVVKEKSTNSIALGGGIDTGLGAFGSISLKEDNFLGRAQRVSLTGILGSGILLSDASIKNHMNYQVELGFFEPYFLNADNSLMSKLYYREMGSWQVPLAIERRFGLKAGVEHKVQGYENLSTSFSAGVEHIHLKEGDFHSISQMYKQNNLDISKRAKQLSDGFFLHLTPGIKYNTLDDKEVPREGVIAQAEYNEAIGISNFNHTHGRLSGAVTRFFPVFKKSSFSLTAKAGVKIHGDEMPEVMAYRLGGPYSIRGYRMNGVGTGESFVMGSAELATPLPFVDKLKWDIFHKMRLTFFVDAGKIYDPTITNVLFDRPEHAITAGIGLRVYIPGVGPISIDYGLPITNPGRCGSENGYFTFGTGGLNMYNY